MNELVKLFKGLSDETRLKILSLLWKRSLCVCEIMGALGSTQTKTSRHLIYLKNMGVLSSKREDRWMVYKINEGLQEEIKKILEHIVSVVKRDEKFLPIEEKLKKILSDSNYRNKFGVLEAE